MASALRFTSRARGLPFIRENYSHLPLPLPEGRGSKSEEPSHRDAGAQEALLRLEAFEREVVGRVPANAPEVKKRP